MGARYIFDTGGQYVAFLHGDNLFSPEADWLGFVRNGSLVYDPSGTFLGLLTEDDRVVRKRHGEHRPRVLRPLRPMKPLRPLKPLRRLRMPTLPLGYEDVFTVGAAPLSREDFSTFNGLLESSLKAADGTFLGLVTGNRFDRNSLLNQFGPHGSRYSNESIFNTYSTYGSEYSPLSPFNQYSTTPPSFIKSGRVIGRLTKNEYVQQRIDPHKFQAWLEQL